MKKFLLFISTLLVLITAEYYFLNEIFRHKRLPIIVVSLALIFISIFAFIRIFKKSILSSDQA